GGAELYPAAAKAATSPNLDRRAAPPVSPSDVLLPRPAGALAFACWSRHRGARKDLQITGTLPLGDTTEVGVGFLDQRLQVVGVQKAVEHLLAGELIKRQIAEFVLAQDLLVAPSTDGAVELQHLRHVFLVVPAIEGGFLILADGGSHHKKCHGHGRRPPGSLQALSYSRH